MTDFVAPAVGSAPVGRLRSMLDQGRRMSKFGLVGLSGLGINSLALWLFTGGLGIYYVLGVILATQVSTAWNFALSDLWVFGDRPGDQGRLRRFGMFWAMNNTALLVRGPMVVVLTGELGVHYLVSNIVSLTVVMLARYVFSDRLVWRAS